MVPVFVLINDFVDYTNNAAAAVFRQYGSKFANYLIVFTNAKYRKSFNRSPRFYYYNQVGLPFCN